MRLLTSVEVGALTKRHPETVTKALREGDLHGFQAKKKTTWVVQEECAIAWRLGQKCSHQTVQAVAA